MLTLRQIGKIPNRYQADSTPPLTRPRINMPSVPRQAVAGTHHRALVVRSPGSEVGYTTNCSLETVRSSLEANHECFIVTRCTCACLRSLCLHN